MLRKYKSGACKRRLKKEREEMAAKLPKMTNFFSSNQTIMQFPQTVDNNENNEKKDENNNTENEVACQGPSNETQEVESFESTMHNNELDSDTILREDPALWPLQLKENERMLELLTQFDPVLKQHIHTFANKGKGNVNYLSKTICEELIDIMSQMVLTHIITEIKKAKYWGIIVDSTPDISHVDQLSVIFRYYLNGHVHDGKSLITDILDLLERYDIDITNCRGQAYDNASNIYGKYSGLQARLKEWSELAFYIPCAGHSLNLVGQCSVGNYATLKRLSDTQWSCRSDASKSLVENFDGIHAALCHIAEDTEEKSDTRHEALCLLNKITKLEFAFMAVLWHHILKRFNAVSKFLQKVELDLYTASSMLLSLIDFVKNLRNDFTRFENESKKLSSFVENDYSDKNKRKLIKKLSKGENQVDSLSVSDKFRVNTFFVIIDKLVTQLTIRSDGYNHLQPPGFFSHKKDKYENENALNPLHVLNWIVETDIIDVFPNFYIAYRLFLTIPITNCEAERSFSTLKRVKNMHRSTMVHSRLKRNKSEQKRTAQLTPAVFSTGTTESEEIASETSKQTSIDEYLKSKKLKKANHISFSSDIWTCPISHKSFISLSGHCIDKDFNRIDVVLHASHFSESHTGVNISEKLESMWNSW
ncbi:zinc finger MYM-type protein 1-like [Hydra vulgaris]|uniref:Zinc finger MYM-type protein 1-like n=1 Tax=Hydra vulgaris TaxID=6087 RepID=A0ABM4DCA3_HYDVU